MVYINPTDLECATMTQANIIFNSRLFWRENVYWSRAFFNSVYYDIGNAQEVFEQLYFIPTEYAYTLRFILLRRIADEFGTVFKRYVIALRELVRAAQAGDIETVNNRVVDLYQIVEDEAIFMSEVFPSINKNVLEEMLKDFLELQIEEINTFIIDDHSRQIEIFEELTSLADKIGDYTSMGIIDLITAAPRVKSASGARSEVDGHGNIAQSICITYDELIAIINLAMFWIEFVMWLRAYRISAMINRGNQEELHNKLIQMTVDYGNVLKSLFDNEEAVDEQTGLMQGYIRLMDELLDARMNNNIDEMNRVYQLSIDNIEKRAEFLDVNFPMPDGTSWMDQLINLHSNLINMSTQFLIGDFAQSIAMFNGLIVQAENMGFVLTEDMINLLIQAGMEPL